MSDPTGSGQPAQTHFGFENGPEAQKASRVGQVFDSVASRYDRMNDLMSVGLHRVWKAFTVAQAALRPGMRVLEVAGGTADLSRQFARRVGPTGEVWLTDINGSMLSIGRDRLLDDGQVHWVQDDDRVIVHAQRGGRVNPVALPAGRTQLGEHLAGVVAALRGDDDLAFFKRLYVQGVFERGFVFGLCGGCTAGVGGGKKHRLNQVEVAFGLHAVHQHRADHAAPAHQTCQLAHFIALSKLNRATPDCVCPARLAGGRTTNQSWISP
jgi:hypothetical protein